MHIEPRPDNYDPIAKIIHAEVTHVGENPAGAISHGFMLAEGPLHYVSADSRESTSKLFSAVKFDVLGEPVGDMYFLPLYSDSKDEYRDRMIANPVYHWQYLILVPWKPGSSSLKRCGLAVGGKLRSDHGVLQVGEHLGLEKGYRIRIN
jgi:hypothetical protein